MKGKFLVFVKLERSIYDAYFKNIIILNSTDTHVLIGLNFVVTTYDNLHKLLSIVLKPIFEMPYSTMRIHLIRNKNFIQLPGVTITLEQLNEVKIEHLEALEIQNSENKYSSKYFRNNEDKF